METRIHTPSLLQAYVTEFRINWHSMVECVRLMMHTSDIAIVCWCCCSLVFDSSLIHGKWHLMTGSWEHTYGPSATLHFLLPSMGFTLTVWIAEWISQLMPLLLLSFVFGVIAGAAEAGQSVSEERLAWYQTRWPEKWLQVNYFTHTILILCKLNMLWW